MLPGCGHLPAAWRQCCLHMGPTRVLATSQCCSGHCGAFPATGFINSYHPMGIAGHRRASMGCLWMACVAFASFLSCFAIPQSLLTPSHICCSCRQGIGWPYLLQYLLTHTTCPCGHCIVLFQPQDTGAYSWKKVVTHIGPCSFACWRLPMKWSLLSFITVPHLLCTTAYSCIYKVRGTVCS